MNQSAVNFGPALDPANTTFSSRDALETYLRPRYLEVVQQLFDTLHLDEHEYGVLASVGAIRLNDQPEAMQGIREHASSIEMWQLQHGVQQYDGFEGDWGSKEAAQAYHARFPTLTLLERLGEGTTRNSPDSQHRRLDDVILTKLGVGGMVASMTTCLFPNPGSRRRQDSTCAAPEQALRVGSV